MKNLFIILLSVLSLMAFAQQKKVAVYVTGENPDINMVLGSKLTTAILNNVGYSAIERTAYFLAAVSKEQSYQHSGAVDDNELSRLGKQLGVQYVCVAAASEVFGEQYVSARLIDVESAQVELTANRSANIQSASGWIDMASSLANALFNSQTKEKQVDSKKVAVYIIKNDASKVIGRVLGDKLVEGFTNSGRYIAIERTNSFLAQLSKEQGYQREGAVDDEEIARLGKQFGVRYVCAANMTDLYGEKFIVVRMIDVEKAEVVNNFDINGAISNMSECVAIANKITEYLSKGTPQELAEERARIEAEREAKIQEQKRIEEERQRALAEERRKKKERVEKRKDQLSKILDKGYAEVVNESTGEKFMICLNAEEEIKGRDYQKKPTFSKFGFSDWKPASYQEYRNILYSTSLDIDFGEGEYGHDFRTIMNDIYYYFRKKIIFTENTLFWLGNNGDYPHKWIWVHDKYTEKYLDGERYSYEWKKDNHGWPYLNPDGIKANIILIRQVK